MASSIQYQVICQLTLYLNISMALPMIFTSVILKWQDFHFQDLERRLAYLKLKLPIWNFKTFTRKSWNAAWHLTRWLYWVAMNIWFRWKILYNSAIPWVRNIWESAKWQWISGSGWSTLFCTTQQFDEQETFEKMQNGNEYLFQVYPHLFVLSNFDCKHYVHFKTLPKAQRTQGLSSSCQSNFLKSYQKFKHKSWSNSSSESWLSINFSVKHQHLQ